MLLWRIPFTTITNHVWGLTGYIQQTAVTWHYICFYQVTCFSNLLHPPFTWVFHLFMCSYWNCDSLVPSASHVYSCCWADKLIYLTHLPYKVEKNRCDLPMKRSCRWPEPPELSCLNKKPQTQQTHKQNETKRLTTKEKQEIKFVYY